ncbi:DUF29 domain-containing protein [Massilia cavernae]|uniref:DUF29 domain-containing protein n=1 Tax=Massilia cavernae TaxID=2320864 RepID=A0A418XGE3_9BURK|nr:DUF29 domain-containing protein [Massilia cavernae]RJG11532.1 DUF29 domain-containing protein [Massilia cavernae]
MSKLNDDLSLRALDDVPAPALYDLDFVRWTEHQAMLVRERRFGELDLENLLEEIESMGSSEHHALRSRLVVLLIHLLKCQFQPERKSESWLATLGEQRTQIELGLERSPSLKSHLAAYIEKAYRSAVRRASIETGLEQTVFPSANPYSAEQILDIDFIP